MQHRYCILRNWLQNTNFNLRLPQLVLHCTPRPSLRFRFFFLIYIKRSGIGWIERKTKFQIFPIFISRVMIILVSFLWRHHPNFRWNFAITRKIKIGEFFFFSFYSAHSTSFIKFPQLFVMKFTKEQPIYIITEESVVARPIVTYCNVIRSVDMVNTELIIACIHNIQAWTLPSYLCKNMTQLKKLTW